MSRTSQHCQVYPALAKKRLPGIAVFQPDKLMQLQFEST
jgi:hypothetical protein